MRKFLTAAVAALTLAGGVAAVAGPAQADQYRYYGHRKSNDNDAGIAIAAGVIGLAIGAALASSSSNKRNSSYYYDNGYSQRGDGGGYYGDGYYGDGYRQPYYNGGYNAPYGYGQDRYAYAPPRVCTSRERVYDRYSGRPMTITRRYAC
jgi:hypothetical protein